MKKNLLISIIALLFLSVTTKGQNYSNMWKQADDAAKKDLPQTQRKVLGQIAKKAEREANYGQLLKALLTDAQVVSTISGDSLLPAVDRLKEREQKAESIPLQAVYQTVLAYIFEHNKDLDDNGDQVAFEYKQKAIAHPEQLAKVKAADYEPFLIRGNDSQLFDHDLLSVIGYETGQFAELNKYYLTTPNRKAQLLTALKMLEQSDQKDNITRIDSLIACYGDLNECGEAAILRLQLMQNHGATPKEQVEYIDQALSRWGNWKRANILRNSRNQLTQQHFTAFIPERVFIPNREQKVTLSFLRGLTDLTLNIYRVNADGDTKLNPYNESDYKKLKPLLTLLPQTTTRHFSEHAEYESFQDSMTLPALPVGVYLIEFYSKPSTQVSRQLYFVSDLRLLMQSLPDNRTRYVVVNATTGQPVKGASIRLTSPLSRRATGPITTLTTDACGECIYTYKEGHQNQYAFTTIKGDRALPPMNIYGQYSFHEGIKKTERTEVFTDRAIYRPGQTVHVAAIIYDVTNGFEHQAKNAKTVKAILRDANYKVVEEKTLTTDEYGTVATDFILPSSGLSGDYRVTIQGAGNQTRFFRVEEYKRPTFQVEMAKPAEDYKAGDTLTVKGTAHSYAGVPVQGARVSYRVERRRAWWWISNYRYWNTVSMTKGEQDQEVLAGEAVTDADGHFEMKMPLVLPETDQPLFCNFIATADVTDAAGETHHGELSLPLGNRNTALTVDLEEKILMESHPKITFHLRNAAGTELDNTLSYRIDNGKWLSAQTQEGIALPPLKSGKHFLEATLGNDTLKREFAVFSLDDKRPAFDTDDWFYLSDQLFPNNGKPVTLQVGSSAKDVHIVYAIVSGNTVIECGAIDKSNELINRKFTYKEEYGNGLALSYAWIKEGKAHFHTTTIRRPLPDKQLRMKWETFRNRLTPGQQEEWTLCITGPDGHITEKPAQLLATLYDKSLDQLTDGNTWSFKPFTSIPLPSLRWHPVNWGGNYFNGSQQIKHLTVSELDFSHFDSDCYPSMWRRRGPILYKTAAKMGSRAIGAAEVLSEATVENAVYDSVDEAALQGHIGALDVAGSTDMLNQKEAAAAPEEKATELQLRENLQETAFFYPQLLADSTGRVSIKFTLPESLTTWSFAAIAHTPDLMYGMLNGEAIAKKDVMIQPNMPRFVRVGDEATLSARIFNTGEQEVSGKAMLILEDPESGETVLSQQTDCLLPANSTQAVTFQVKGAALQDHALLVCKMLVSGETFSDGGQHYLPVIPNRERVTVAVPFTQTQPGTKTVDIARLLPETGSQPQFTIEYTNNPAWLMIQALPTIGHPHDGCAICQAASLYANSLGLHILEQNPQAKHVFETWQQEKGAETSLLSELEKNENLKDLLLSETPWVTDANRETEQKHRLADFFDHNSIQTRLSSAIDQLQKLQNSDGSWSWWPGMRGSFYMTVEVSEMMVRLLQMTEAKNEVRQMLNKSFKFMDKEILLLVADMKKEEKNGHRQSFPSYKALQYLYITTLDARQPSPDVADAQTYLKNLLKKETRQQTIYEKALSAVILNDPLYIKSLKEHTVYKEDMGRYYDTHRAAYSWRDYRIPTQVAAIEAIQRLTPSDTATIDEMRRWLLQEKRTQAWDTPINSADAIYAFLNGNQQALKPQARTVLKMDGQELETSHATAGIGYVKTTVHAQGAKTFSAEKTSSGTSWGAVYAQFMQPAKDIADQGSELSVKREIIPSPLSTMTLGQRVKVRITITAQRDLDFVEVIDRRAACMEPIVQLSGYRDGAYCTPKDNATHYFFDLLTKGKHVIETEYYIDRTGLYETGTCTAQCAYAPEFRATTHSLTLSVTE